jgi:subtilisin-like proprotein convertase family protein
VSRCTAASPGVLIALTLAFLPVVGGLGSAHAGTQTSCTAAEYASNASPVAIPDPGSIDGSLSVPSGGEVQSLTVGVDITHPLDSDLHLQLVSPAGTVIELANGIGMWGHDFTGTVFDDQAAGSIVSQPPPFTGDFRPIEPLSTLQGSPQGGTWKLRVTDRIGGYSGQLDSWKLDITSCPSVSPPTQPPAGAATPPPLPTGVPSGALPVQGTPITVATNSDDSDGDVSSVANLLSNPGPDGTISLREAILATNNDPGTYTIRFDPSLAGSTISVTGAGGSLPALTGGHVLIDGDTNGDGTPDITIAAGGSNPNWAFDVASSGNRIHALAISGFPFGVLFTAGPQGVGSLATGQTYQGNVVDGDTITATQAGIKLSPVEGREGGECASGCQTHDAWTDTRLVGNSIEAAQNGIDVELGADVGDSVSRITVAGNRINFSGGLFGVTFAVGAGGGETQDRLADALVAFNILQGSGGNGGAINAWSGLQGGTNNTINGLDVLGNDSSYSGTAPPGNPSRGVSIGMSDGCSGAGLGQGVCSKDNSASNISIERNNLQGQVEGILATDACCGPAMGSTLTGVTISENVIAGAVPATALNPWGVVVGCGGANVSDVNVDSNTIEQAPTEPGVEYAADLAGGGVAVLGGLGKGNVLVDGSPDPSTVTHVSLSGNLINTDLAGITLVGGGPSDEVAADDATGNSVSGVQLTGNVIGREPTLARRIDPQVKGISLIGGLGGTPPATGNWKASTDNSVTSVTLQGNLVAGVTDDVSVQSNFGAGASGNTAALGLRPPTLTVAKTGDGSGVVTSNPVGISCPSSCSAAFDDRSEITLTVAAARSSTFAGWSGGGCSGDDTCTVTMNGDQSVTATFEALCVVPKLKGKWLGMARTAIKRAHCSVGKITRVKSSKKRKNHVISQSPRAGAHRARGSKIALKVGKGGKRTK